MDENEIWTICADCEGTGSSVSTDDYVWGVCSTCDGIGFAEPDDYNDDYNDDEWDTDWEDGDTSAALEDLILDFLGGLESLVQDFRDDLRRM